MNNNNETRLTEAQRQARIADVNARAAADAEAEARMLAIDVAASIARARVETTTLQDAVDEATHRAADKTAKANRKYTRAQAKVTALLSNPK